MNGNNTDLKVILQSPPLQQQNSMIAVSGVVGGDGQVVTTLMSTTNTLPRPHQVPLPPPPTMMINSFDGRSFNAPSLLNCCPLWPWFSPIGPLDGHHQPYQLTLVNPFSGRRLGVVSLLLKSLIVSMLLNLLLASWIIVSLRLHQNSNPLRGQRIGINSFRRSPVTLTVDGSLTAKGNLQVENILAGNGGSAFEITSNDDQLTLSTKKQNQSFSFENLQQTITLSGHSFEVKTNNLVVEKDGKTVLQLTPKMLSFEGGNRGPDEQQLKAPPGGLWLTDQLDTTEVRSHARHDFRIESRTGALHLTSQRAIEVESMSTGQNPSTVVQAHGDLQLIVDDNNKSGNQIGGEDGSESNSEGADQHHHHLHFDSANVQMGHLRGGNQQHFVEQQHPLRHHQHHQQQLKTLKTSGEEVAYQLCVCGSGHLFATAVEGICEADQTVCAS